MTPKTTIRRYLLPNKVLTNYLFPEELAIWSLHLAGIDAHSNTHSPTMKENIPILDQHGQPLGGVSFLEGRPEHTIVIVSDSTFQQTLINAIEAYIEEVLGIQDALVIK